jgi:hypothetical protein
VGTVCYTNADQKSATPGAGRRFTVPSACYGGRLRAGQFPEEMRPLRWVDVVSLGAGALLLPVEISPLFRLGPSGASGEPEELSPQAAVASTARTAAERIQRFMMPPR